MRNQIRSTSRRRTKKGTPTQSIGCGQLTLVEHALCPLAGGANGPLMHRSTFQYMDQQGNRKKANATTSAAFGLLPGDEFYLWGLLGLTLNQTESSGELLATPHFLLRHLGVIDAATDRGGSAYRAFRDALQRLAGVVYHCDGFYDPIRREHRVTTFGFLSYSLPIDPLSSRTWRIVWDPIFVEFCRDARGSLGFDIGTYRTLDPASRRLYLFLSKIFWRREWTHWLDVRMLAIDVLGFAPSIAMRNLKQKLKRAIERLAEHGLIQLPSGATTKDLFIERDDGGCLVRLRRGPSLRRGSAKTTLAAVKELAIYDPLHAIGFDDEAIGRISRQYKHALIQQWADITLAAKEKQGPRFFKKSPQAFLIDNLRNGRTPPDWWWACKKEQEQRISSALAKQLVECSKQPRPATERDFANYMKGPGRLEFEKLTVDAADDFRRTGLSGPEAIKRATELCIAHLRARFTRSRVA